MGYYKKNTFIQRKLSKSRWKSLPKQSWWK